MEAEAEAGHGRLTRRPMLASSWDAACGALDQRLGVTGPGLGARDLDWEELLAPPAPSRDLVILKRRLNGQDESPCFLYLSCNPNGGEEIFSVGILSSARNMEVYIGEEYCGTSRGQNVCNILGNSEHEIIFYKNYLKLESSTLSCKIKLLSFGEKQCVLVSKVVVHVRPVTEHSSSSPALGSRIDLERVQTIMQSMGSKLSPGAQQLMSMVRVQQQQCRPLGELLPSLWGNAAYQRVIDLCSSSASGAFPRASSTPFPLRTGLTSGAMTQDLRAPVDKSAQAPGGGNVTHPEEYKLVSQHHSPRESDLKKAAPSSRPNRAGHSSGSPDSELLPLLQTLCGHVNLLRVGPSPEWPGPLPTPSEGGVGAATGEQPVCSYLEKILSKNMELMEKKLTDYIDQRIQKLQAHIDDKVALLTDLLRTPSPPPSGTPLRHCDSGEGLSNGER